VMSTLLRNDTLKESIEIEIVMIIKDVQLNPVNNFLSVKGATLSVEHTGTEINQGTFYF